MIKKSPNDKMVTSDKEKTKAITAPKTTGLICVRECVMPGIGHFLGGQKITDATLIGQIGVNHPNFQEDK